MKPQVINTTEWRIIKDIPPETAESLSRACTTFQDPETLGLHERNGAVRPGNFVGVVRVGDCVLRVDSKFPQMDYVGMFLRCADHPTVGGHMESCLTFWPEQAPIETEKAEAFCVLVASAFLRELNDLCARRLRRNFIREEANLSGKAKGKIPAAENIRRNVLRGRAERVFCAFQSVSDDILENRILRAALERASVFLFSRPEGSGGDDLRRWVRACRSALRGVSAVRVRGGDFAGARVRGAFSHYRRPLRLARAVLESTGFDLEGNRPSAVSPFALNSAELFERWAELRLLERPDFTGLRAGYARGNTFAWEGGEIAVRPDFWIPARTDEAAMILDAKYKPSPKNIREVSRKDIYQMVAYSRHRRLLRDKLEVDETGEVRLALLYPEVGEGDIQKDGEDESFCAPLSVWRVPCPEKKDSGALAARAAA